jgi:AAA family ATP:ADP antiporter
MKKFGLRFCILFYPIIFALCLIGLYAYYQTNPTPEHLLWVIFGVMITVTAASYAVNNPIKEMMYIPTSNNAKFKVKGITDTVGSRGGKMVGSSIAGTFNVVGNITASIANLMAFGTLIGLGFIGIWIVAAFYVGNKNAQLVRDNQIIE